MYDPIGFKKKIDRLVSRLTSTLKTYWLYLIAEEEARGIILRLYVPHNKLEPQDDLHLLAEINGAHIRDYEQVCSLQRLVSRRAEELIEHYQAETEKHSKPVCVI